MALGALAGAAGAAGAAGGSTAATIGTIASGTASLMNASGLFRASLKKQARYAKDMANYNDAIADQNAKDAWERQKELNQIQYEQNSYPTLMKQLEEAGLNKSLALGSASAGGQGSGGSVQSAGGGTGEAVDIAPLVNAQSMGLTGLGTQITELAKMQAEIDLAKSQAEKNRAEAKSVTGEEGTVGASEIAKNLGQVGLMESQKKVEEANAEYQNIQNRIATATEDEQIELMMNAIEQSRNAIDLTHEELKRSRIDTTIKSRTMENVIKEQAWNAASAMANAYKIKADTEAIATQLAQGWAEIAVAKDANEVQRAQTEMYRKVSNMMAKVSQRNADVDYNKALALGRAMVYGSVAGGLAGGVGMGAAKSWGTWQPKMAPIGF